MSAPKSRAMKDARQMRLDAQALDDRRQRQIANQVETINRLLDDPDAAAEIARLQARIADLEGDD